MKKVCEYGHHVISCGIKPAPGLDSSLQHPLPAVVDGPPCGAISLHAVLAEVPWDAPEESEVRCMLTENRKECLSPSNSDFRFLLPQIRTQDLAEEGIPEPDSIKLPLINLLTSTPGFHRAMAVLLETFQEHL